MRTILTLAFFITNLNAFAQTIPHKFQWSSTPSIHQVQSNFRDEAAVYIQERKIIEFAQEKEGFFQYKTIHRIIHINNDKGIESFNKVYLPFNEDGKLIDVKARTILPNKKVIELNEKNIKEIKEENQVYKIFALDGLTKDCEVEYYYTIKMEPSFMGREFVSYKLPVQESHFEIISPDHLRFEIKPYSFSPVKKDSVFGGKFHTWFNMSNLDAESEEKYSMSDANIKRVEFKLSYNHGQSAKDRLFTWNELAKKVFAIYTTVTEKEIKKVKDLVSDAGIHPNMKEMEKIIRLENHFKKTFISRDNISNEDAEDLIKAMKNKVMSERAFCKMFGAAFTLSNINYQIVLTGDRSDYILDKSFENWNNAKNFLFYFPDSKKFMAPTHIAYRFPWIPPTWAGTNGLFCVETSLGGFKSAYGEIKSIPLEDYHYSFSNMDIKASLTKEQDALDLELKHSFGGYTSINYKAPFVFYPPEDQKEFLKNIIRSGTNSEKIEKHSFENKELEQKDPYAPFVINASVKSTNLVERAGNKILIKLGELIGEQAQMYEESERKTNVELEYPHALVRTITLNIPAGYEIRNLKDLDFNIIHKENEKVTMGFVTSYEFKQDQLKITIKEDYDAIFYPLSLYATYKKVINAAADFNKVILVLEKK
jgi:hypothetical protein